MGPGATRSTASAAVEAVLASILLSTRTEGEKLHIAHFGTFERTRRSARRGYDINTGTMRNIPEKEELTFKAARGFLTGSPGQPK